MLIRTCFTVFYAAIPCLAMAEDCSSYPYISGTNIETVDGGVKIISTASVGLDFNDVDAVNDARLEAELKAKAEISKFLSEQIKSDESINQAVETTKSMQGEDKKVFREEAKKSVRDLRLSSAYLLKGVVNLGSCVTPGKELRLSVGLKPETIKNAEALAADLKQDAGKTAQTGKQPGTGGMNPVSGYSDSAKVGSF